MVSLLTTQPIRFTGQMPIWIILRKYRGLGWGGGCGEGGLMVSLLTTQPIRFTGQMPIWIILRKYRGWGGVGGGERVA